MVYGIVLVQIGPTGSNIVAFEVRNRDAVAARKFYERNNPWGLKYVIMPAVYRGGRLTF